MKVSDSMAPQWTWQHIDTKDPEAVANARSQYGLTKEQTDYARDRHERAHVEYDTLAKTFLLVFNIPDADADAAQEEQHQMTFILKDNVLLTFGHGDAQSLIAAANQQLPNWQQMTPYQFLLEILYLITERFMPLVETADAARHSITLQLKKKATRKRLLDLSGLETNALYLGNAAKHNGSVLAQLKGISVYHDFTPAEKERLEDVIIESDQLVAMTELGSQNLTQLEATYNNILNNNLNDTMKFLTIWSLVLTAPTIISGYFGQNVPLPLMHSSFGWLITLGLAVGLSVIFAVIMSAYIRK